MEFLTFFSVDFIISGTILRPSVQTVFREEFCSEHVSRGFEIIVKSTKVGNTSTSSTKLSSTAPVNPGTCIMSGIFVASSKLLYFANSPCSPLDQP